MGERSEEEMRMRMSPGFKYPSCDGGVKGDGPSTASALTGGRKVLLIASSNPDRDDPSSLCPCGTGMKLSYGETAVAESISVPFSCDAPPPKITLLSEQRERSAT